MYMYNNAFIWLPGDTTLHISICMFFSLIVFVDQKPSYSVCTYVLFRIFLYVYCMYIYSMYNNAYIWLWGGRHYIAKDINTYFCEEKSTYRFQRIVHQKTVQGRVWPKASNKEVTPAVQNDLSYSTF